MERLGEPDTMSSGVPEDTGRSVRVSWDWSRSRVRRDTAGEGRCDVGGTSAPGTTRDRRSVAWTYTPGDADVDRLGKTVILPRSPSGVLGLGVQSWVDSEVYIQREGWSPRTPRFRARVVGRSRVLVNNLFTCVREENPGEKTRHLVSSSDRRRDG